MKDVLSEELVMRHMKFEGPPFAVFWKNDKKVRFALNTVGM